jgi:hypothetical protein
MHEQRADGERVCSLQAGQGEASTTKPVVVQRGNGAERTVVVSTVRVVGEPADVGVAAGVPGGQPPRPREQVLRGARRASGGAPDVEDQVEDATAMHDVASSHVLLHDGIRDVVEDGQFDAGNDFPVHWCS